MLLSLYIYISCYFSINFITLILLWTMSNMFTSSMLSDHYFVLILNYLIGESIDIVICQYNLLSLYPIIGHRTPLITSVETIHALVIILGSAIIINLRHQKLLKR